MINIDLPGFMKKALQIHSLSRFVLGYTGGLKLGFSDETWLATFEFGNFTGIEKVSPDTAADLSILAADEEWLKFLEPNPKPFYNGIGNAAAFHGFETQQNLQTIQYQAFINELTFQMRRYYNGEEIAVQFPEPRTPNTRFEETIGRYVYLTIDGIEYRVYYEESGQGIPLLLQHTAGANGQEYRFLMEDPDFTKDFRMIAYDLPYHGKSMPPADYPWWEKDYQLTLDFLLKFLEEFCKALNLDRPAFMGCSMGGHLAADLACHRPDMCRAAIGIGPGLRTDPTIFGGKFDIDIFNMVAPFTFKNPQINNYFVGTMNEFSCVLPPLSSVSARKEVYWSYATTYPGIFGGDLHYYNYDHDLTDQAGEIDTTKCMLYLMAGDFDHATPPATVRKLADAVKGSRLVEMEGVGHYAMTECYNRFKVYLKEVAEEIKSLS